MEVRSQEHFPALAHPPLPPGSPGKGCGVRELAKVCALSGNFRNLYQ